MNEHTDGETPMEFEEATIGLSAVLASLPLTREFGKRCEKAAQVAYSLEKLRRERSRRGFLANSVSAYFKRLAAYTQIDLDPVLKAYALPDLSIKLDRVSDLVSFLRQVGFSVAEAIAMIRIGFCEQQGLEMLPASAVSFRSASGGESDELTRVEQSLDELEQSYSPESRDTIGRIVLLIESGFQSR